MRRSSIALAAACLLALVVLMHLSDQPSHLQQRVHKAQTSMQAFCARQGLRGDAWAEIDAQGVTEVVGSCK